MIVEELVATLGLEIDPAAIAKVGQFAEAIKSKMLSAEVAFTALAAGAVAAIVSTANAADAIGDAAERLGVGAQGLQELQFAAKMSDASVESLESGLKFLSKTMAEAAAGSKEARAALEGLNVTDAIGNLRDPTKVFAEFADKVAALPPGAARTALAMKVLGRGGLELVPLLNQGSEGIAKFAARAAELNYILDGDALKAGGEFDKALKELTASIGGVRNAFGAPLIGAVTAFVELLTEGMLALQPVMATIAQAFVQLGRHIKAVLGPLKQIVNGLRSFLPELKVSLPWVYLVEAAIIALGVAFVRSSAQMVLWAGVWVVHAAQVSAAWIAASARMALAWVVAAAPIAVVAGLIALVTSEMIGLYKEQDTLVSRFEKWALNPMPEDTGPVKLLKSMLALILDIANPVRWKVLYNAIVNSIPGLSAILPQMVEGKSPEAAAPLGHLRTHAEDLNAKTNPTPAGFAPAPMWLNPADMENAAAPRIPMSRGAPASYTNHTQATINVTPFPGMNERSYAQHTVDILQSEMSKASAATSGGK